MKFIISEVRFDEMGAYIGRTCSIQQWFCEQEGISKVNEGVLLRVSEKAMLFHINHKNIWIPKSLIDIVARKEKLLGDFSMKFPAFCQRCDNKDIACDTCKYPDDWEFPSRFSEKLEERK